MLPCMNEYQFAVLFVAVNKEKIQKNLQIKYLNEEETIKTIAKFLEQNNLCKKFEKQSYLLYDEKFYTEIMNFLHNAKNIEMTPEEYIDYLTKKFHKHTFVE